MAGQDVTVTGSSRRLRRAMTGLRPRLRPTSDSAVGCARTRTASGMLTDGLNLWLLRYVRDQVSRDGLTLRTLPPVRATPERCRRQLLLGCVS
jgi:hypothetical protein